MNVIRRLEMTLMALFLIASFLSAQPVADRSKAGSLIKPTAKEKMPALNGLMKVDSLWESTRVITEEDKALILVHSEVRDLRFESNRLISKVNPRSSGYYEMWIPFGTHILKFDAAGFQRLELPAHNYSKKRVYELKISGILKNQRSATEKGTLIITSTPDGAAMKIDGLPDFKGTTPYAMRDYAAGTYLLMLSKDKYESKEAIVLVEKDKSLTENLVLTPKFGYLEVMSEANARVMVDSAWVIFPPGRPAEVPVGIHKVSVLSGGRILKDTTIVVPPGITVQLSARSQ
jgi:hypothetical protein